MTPISVRWAENRSRRRRGPVGPAPAPAERAGGRGELRAAAPLRLGCRGAQPPDRARPRQPGARPRRRQHRRGGRRHRAGATPAHQRGAGRRARVGDFAVGPGARGRPLVVRSRLAALLPRGRAVEATARGAVGAGQRRDPLAVVERDGRDTRGHRRDRRRPDPGDLGPAVAPLCRGRTRAALPVPGPLPRHLRVHVPGECRAGARRRLRLVSRGRAGLRGPGRSGQLALDETGCGHHGRRRSGPGSRRNGPDHTAPRVRRYRAGLARWPGASSWGRSPSRPARGFRACGSPCST